MPLLVIAFLCAVLSASCGSPLLSDAPGSRAFVYVTKQGTNDVSVYTLNNDGSLSFLSLTSTGGGLAPQGIATDALGRFAYVANRDSNSLSAFSIAASTGALTYLGGYPTDAQPQLPVVDPSGRRIYVANKGASTVTAYSINSSTGALTLIGARATGNAPIGMAIDASGSFAFVAGSGANTISVHAIDSTTGALGAAQAYAAGSAPAQLAFDTVGSVLYAANSGDGTVSVFSEAAGTGVLALLQTAAAGAGATGVAMAPDRSYVFVTNKTDSTVSSYTVAGNGALTLQSTIAAPVTPLYPGVDSGSAFLVVPGNGDHGLASYKIAPPPASAPLARSATGTAGPGTNPVAVLVARTFSTY
ncbi:MAG: beta-propeller fold lactonase family protein [Deltaproteobacteria bacterium]|nr:beta-propeller fold lactonase family protein [Deltaproteobacteria bacterium]